MCYNRIVNKKLFVRRINISANHVVPENTITIKKTHDQLDLFTNYEELEKQEQEEAIALEKEKNLQKAILGIKKRYGKNAILKGTNFEEGATTIERNDTIGGHKA